MEYLCVIHDCGEQWHVLEPPLRFDLRLATDVEDARRDELAETNDKSIFVELTCFLRFIAETRCYCSNAR